jgi:hypothetical protein
MFSALFEKLAHPAVLSKANSAKWNGILGRIFFLSPRRNLRLGS